MKEIVEKREGREGRERGMGIRTKHVNVVRGSW